MDSGSLKYIQEPPHEELLPPPRRFRLPEKRRLALVGAAVLILFVFYRIFLAAPAGNQANEQTIVTIPSGEGLTGAARILSSAHQVRSQFFLKALVVLFGGPRAVQAGDYYFERPESAIWVAWRLTHSVYELVNVRITVPEGLNSKEISLLFANQPLFTKFDQIDFLKAAAPHEGYLFPDTYFFPPNVTARAVVDAMLATYQKRITDVRSDIAAFGRPEADVIKMASILEEEGRTTETREIIAGILWKRLDQGMPLQVDSAFALVNGKKASKDISLSDLAIDSPYNTYTHKGLPPTAISNPGLDSIRAAVHPIATKYYYYLSDDQGNMHYAVTLDEHVANKQKYLSN
ncbi:MAG TPA: endolytic transglycosylase MltG [Candidatus Paceibacterota bacterium]|nr:endolytic transglycosylase MltG [Candidatus Paceibacterota bacterium]